jgi:hypothetical protein
MGAIQVKVKRRIQCSCCGKAVSTEFLPIGVFVLGAYVECPECIQRHKDEGYAHIAQQLRRRISEWWEQGESDFATNADAYMCFRWRVPTLARCANDILPTLAIVEALAEKERK